MSCEHLVSSRPPPVVVSSSFQLVDACFSCLLINASLLTFQLLAYNMFSSTKAIIFFLIFLFGDKISYPLLLYSSVVIRGILINVHLIPDDLAPCPCLYMLCTSVDKYDVVEVQKAVLM